VEGGIFIGEKKRKRGVPLCSWVSEAEYDIIRQRMEDMGPENLSAYLRKMALNGVRPDRA
jgi:hypothetical protein